MQVADVCLQCAFGGVLRLGVQSCRDFELCLAPIFDTFLLEEFVEKVAVEAFFQAFKCRAHREAEVAVVEFQGLCDGCIHVGLLDVAFFDHAAEHVAESRLAAFDCLLPAFFGALDERVVVERSLDRACNECAFGKRQVLEFLVEEVLGGDSHTLACTRDVELVQVKFQDVFLGKVLFHAERVQEFLELFLDAAFFAAENVLDRLLCERGTALAHSPRLDVVDHGAHEPLEVVTVVGPVAGVFGSDKGVDQVDRNIAIGHVNAVVRVEECAEQVFTVFVEDAGFAGEHLQDGGAVKLVVRIAFGENLEHDDIKGDVANQGYKEDSDDDFNKLIHIYVNY